MNQQLIRARGFVDSIRAALKQIENRLEEPGDLAGLDDLSVDDHANILARLHTIEMAGKMVKELVADVMKRKVLEDKA